MYIIIEYIFPKHKDIEHKDTEMRTGMKFEFKSWIWIWIWISIIGLILILSFALSSVGWNLMEGLEMRPAMNTTMNTTMNTPMITIVDASLNEMLQSTGWKPADTVLLNKPTAPSAAYGVGGDLGVGDGGVGAIGDKVSENKTSNKMYNPDNFDVTYHPMPAIPDVWKLDADGKLIKVPYYEVKNKTWYSVGKYPAIYVPNYEESVFLSRGK